MITVISGTDRHNSNTLKVAELCCRLLQANKEECELLDLTKLPANIFNAKNYGNKSPEMERYQTMILKTDGILVVTPEYNGSFPGALKYFIDLLKFPESLYRKPCAFVGVSSGSFGGLRPVEHLEMVFNYREANLFGQRVFIARVTEKLSPDGKDITDAFVKDLLVKMISGFSQFVNKLK